MTQNQKKPKIKSQLPQSTEARCTFPYSAATHEVSRQVAAPKSALLQKDSEGKTTDNTGIKSASSQPFLPLRPSHSRISPSTRRFNAAQRALDPDKIRSKCHTKAGPDDFPRRKALAAQPAPVAQRNTKTCRATTHLRQFARERQRTQARQQKPPRPQHKCML